MTESLHFTYLELGRLRIPFWEPGLCQSLLERFAYSVKYINRLEDCPAKTKTTKKRSIPTGKSVLNASGTAAQAVPLLYEMSTI